MSGKNILAAIRKTSFKRLLLPFVFVVMLITIYYFMPFSDVFDPKEANSSSQAVALYNANHQYAKINLKELYYTGYDIMSENEVKASYYYDITDNKCTFYLLDKELVKDKPLVLNNISINVKFNDKDGLFKNMISSFAQSLDWTTEGIQSITSSVVMEQTEYHYLRYAVLYGLIILILLYSVVIITINIIFILVPWVHPVLLKYYYTNHDVSILKDLQGLQNEIENNVNMYAGNMFITDKYFINLGPNEVGIIPLNKIVIGYEHGKLRSFFGIHLKISHTLNLKGYGFQKVVATGKEDTDITEVMNYLKNEYPDIIWGHTKENKTLASKTIKQYRSKSRVSKRFKNRFKKKAE